ncbi:C-type lectin domain family 11 member A [Xenopus laevis]|uniref:C-type lectin domain family 11 member A n=1 Tax=Xenopus laevis TaxID=8355 RepID=A0A8J1LDB6_XENLA|nr:C-type lectin domain family 11 member A [Xenopus laevis]
MDLLCYEKMLLERLLLGALCMSLIPSILAQEETAAKPLGLGNITESVVIIEKRGDTPDVIIDTYLRKIFFGNEEVTVPPPDSPHILPNTDAPQNHDVKRVFILQNGKHIEQDIEKEEEAEEEEDEIGENEKEDDKLEDSVPTIASQPSTTAHLDDNFNYFMSRLSAIESAIHRLNVQFFGLNVKVNQMSQSLSTIRTKLVDVEDNIATVSELNLRNQRQIGQIEGCFKGRRLLRKCYLIFQHFENYETAQKLCHSRGGNLAMPIDEQEYAALAKYIHDSFFPFNWHIWIGINDLHTEGMYQYENGHRVSFFNWYKDQMIVQPNGRTLENCVSVTSIDGKWWDHDCSRRMFYVCEY